MRPVLLVFLGTALALICVPRSLRAGGEPQSSELQMDGRTQGTTYRVRGYSKAPLTREQREGLFEGVEALLHRIDALMSAWRADSEIERFNRTGTGIPFSLSEENASILMRAREFWRLTGGVFDPTIGRSIRLWGFGGAPRRSDLPTDQEVVAAKAQGGFDGLELVGHQAIKRRDGLLVDLSGIAQGYTVDRVFVLLREAGFERLLVEIGGELRAGSPPPGQDAWRIGVQDPSGEGLGQTLALTDASASTSGDYESHFEVAGVSYSHILDPRTGRPVATGVASATVIAPDCTEADALAKAVIILQAEETLKIIESQPQVACRFLVRSGGGSYREVQSRGYAGYVR